MKLKEILKLVDGRLISRNANLEIDVLRGCGADLMSDVLSFCKERAVLLTGLTNPQVVRTAEMADVVAVVFVRGKLPAPETIALAEEKGIPLIAAKYTMFEMCGRLHAGGLASCDDLE